MQGSHSIRLRRIDINFLLKQGANCLAIRPHHRVGQAGIGSGSPRQVGGPDEQTHPQTHAEFLRVHRYVKFKLSGGISAISE